MTLPRDGVNDVLHRCPTSLLIGNTSLTQHKNRPMYGRSLSGALWVWGERCLTNIGRLSTEYLSIAGRYTVYIQTVFTNIRTMLNTSANYRSNICICLAMHRWAFNGAYLLLHVHNIQSAKCQDHKMTPTHLQRGMAKAWRVERASFLGGWQGQGYQQVQRGLARAWRLARARRLAGVILVSQIS